jgi:two-component system chemotaxis response regulator CheB
VRRVLIVEDSAFTRRALASMIESEPGLALAACAADGEEAIRLSLRHRPDLVVLDLGLPKVGGLGFLRWIMRHQPVPVLVVTGARGGREVFQALEIGAVDFLLKPSAHASEAMLEMREDLLDKLRVLDSLPGRRRARTRRKAKPAIVREPVRVRRTPSADLDEPPLVVIGASTGGPPALQYLLSGLPSDWPGSIVVAQHMPARFTDIFAQRLNRTVGLEVIEASEAETVKPGRCLILPGGKQGWLEKRAERLIVRLRVPREDEHYTPSVDLLFTSAAVVASGRVAALVLTGMGDDGVEGVCRVRQAGGQTVAEDQRSAVVFGMPGEAIRTGCIDEVLPLERIARWLERLGSKSASKKRRGRLREPQPV